MAGWGEAAFPGDTAGTLQAYWWVPIVAPIIGAAIGAFVYDFLINDVLKARMKASDPHLTQRGEVAEDDL